MATLRSARAPSQVGSGKSEQRLFGTQILVHEHGVGNRRLVIRRDLLEAERAIERKRGLHGRERVETHGGVTHAAAFGDGGFGERAAGAGTARGTSNIEPLHLA